MESRFVRLWVVLAAVLTAGFSHGDVWTPAETNTWGWWDPSVLTNMTTDGSGGVTTLYDLSGGGRNMAPQGGGNPSSFTRLLGNRYGLDFVKVKNDRLQYGSSGWTDLGSNGVISFYAVYDHDSDTQNIINFQDDCHFGYSAINPYGKRSPGNGGMSYTGGPYTDVHIFSAHMVFDSSTNLPLSYFNAYVDSTKVTTNRAYISQVPVDHGSRFTFMTGNNNGLSQDGGLGEIIVTYDASDSSRQMIEGYLAHKWGLTANLTNGHPYKFEPPIMPGSIEFWGLVSSNVTAATADLYSTGNSNLTSCTLLWDTVDKGITNVLAWSGSRSLGSPVAGPVSGTATNLSPDKTYYYRFYGENGSTNGWSTWAGTFVTPITTASVPAFSSTTSTHNSVTLEWDDNASTETAYVLQRSTNGIGFIQLAVLAEDTTNYVDEAVADGQTYYYRLYATNSVSETGTDPAACETNATPMLSGEMIFYEGFEDPMIDGSVGTNPTGWVELSTGIGMSDSAVTGKTGDQFAKVHGIGDANGMMTTSAILSSNLMANYRYTLTCDAAWNESRSGWAVMKLIAGSTVIAGATNAVVTHTDFSKTTLSITFVTPSGHPDIGQPLSISLSRTNGWGNSDAYFDNLALYATDTSTDAVAPTPSPMTWEGLPTSSVSNSITMSATNAADESGVQYFFTNTVNGNVSGWQDSAVWTDTGLDPGLTYSYKVKARDKSPNTNETSWSSVKSAECEANIILYESFETPSILPSRSVAFENPPLPPAGWVGDGAQYVANELNPPTPTVSPFGAQYADISGYIETSALSNHVLQAEYIYRIMYNTGCAGNRVGEEDGVPGDSKLELYAGTNVVASNTVSVTLDDFSETNAVEFIPDAEHPDLGEPLKIRISKTAGNWWTYVICDNIKLYAVPPDPKGTVLIIR